jgi:hypothetical protein
VFNRPDVLELSVDLQQPNHVTDADADVKVESLLSNGHVEANYINHEQNNHVHASSNGGNAVPLLGQAA